MTSSRLSSLLRRILKIFGIAFVIFTLLFGVASWIVIKKGNDWILNQIQSYVNDSQSGQLEISTINLEILRNFPNATIALNGINYFEHTDSLRLAEEKPILYAEQLFISVEFLALLQDELKVSEISLSKARLHIIEHEDGVLNVDLAMRARIQDSSKQMSAIQINLQAINLNDLMLTWNSLGPRTPVEIMIKKLDANLSKNGSVMDIDVSAENHIKKVKVNSVSLPTGDLNLDAELSYDGALKKLIIKKSELNYDEFSASIQGSYSHDKNRMLDLEVDASSNDLALLSMIIKPEVMRQNRNLLQQGDIYIKGKVFGPLKTKPPQFNIAFGVRDLALRLPEKIGVCKDVGFEGRFVSGRKANYSEARIDIRNLRGQLPGGFLRGQFSVKNFVEPDVKYNLDAQLKLDGYDEIFRMDFLKQLRGTVSIAAKFDGLLKDIDKHRLDSTRSSIIKLDSLSFVWTKTNQLISGLSGKIINGNNQSVFQELGFTYGKNKLLLNATIDNLFYFLLERNNNLVLLGNVRADTLYTKDFVLDTLLEANVQDRISKLYFDFLVSTSVNENDEQAMPDLSFDICNLSAQFEKLPDIKKLDFLGGLGETANGLKLDLKEFHAKMPYGSLDVEGDLLIREKQLLEFNARVHANKFPWNYIMELVAEIRSEKEPTQKNISVSEMDIITADLDLSAAVIAWPFDISKLVVRNSPVQISFPGPKSYSVEKLNIDCQLQFMHPENSGSIIGVKSTAGLVDLKGLKTPTLQNKIDINLKVNGKDDSLDFEFSSSTQKAKSEKGHLFLDISKQEPGYHLQYYVTDANLESLIGKFHNRRLMTGNIDYHLDVRAIGSDWSKARQNLSGELEIKGDSLRLYGADIDNVLKKFNKSQNFNLTDLGAVLVAGPVGLAVTKGSDFVLLASVNIDSTHQTKIKTLNARWRLENNILSTKDVAFSTHLNRIAFDGQIDLAHDSIPGFVIAVIDKDGCSLMDQKLYGKIGKLQKGKLNITKTLLGSVTNFVNAIVGKGCTPVYTGTVKDPLH